MVGVSTKSQEWIEDELARGLPQALREGIPALKRDAGFPDLGVRFGRAVGEHVIPGGSSIAVPGIEAGANRWLFPNPGEMETLEESGFKFRTRFEYRVRRLRFNNVFKRALSGAAAMPFRNPMVAEGWPASVQRILSNVDGNGSSLTSFVRNASEGKFFAGIHFAIVEISQDGTGDPYWLSVPASDWTNWTWAFEGGRVRLIEARVRTAPNEPDLAEDPNEYDPEAEVGGYTVYRAGDPTADVGSDAFKYRVKTYKGDADGMDDFIESEEGWKFPGRGKLSDIPAVAFQSSWDEPYRSPPRFQDAAHDQMETIRSRSELDDFIRRAKQPTTYLSGVTDEEYTDQGDLILLHKEQSKPYLIELDAASIEALSAEITKSEANIGIACLDPMVEQVAGPATATEIVDRSVRSSIWLEVSARSDESTVFQLLSYTTQILGLDVPENAKVNLPAGFMESFQSQDKIADFFRQMANDGFLSTHTLWEILKKLEVGVEEDFDVEEELARIKAQKATSPTEPPAVEGSPEPTPG